MTELFIYARGEFVATAQTLQDADAYCGHKFKNVSTYVNSVSFEALETFTEAELRFAVEKHYKGDYSSASLDALQGLALKLLKELPCVPASSEASSSPYEIPTVSANKQLQDLGDYGLAKQAQPRLAQRTRANSAAPAKRPREGTASFAIWEKCDDLKSSVGLDQVKSLVLEWGEQQGLNKSTVRTQYGHWFKFCQSDNV